MIKKIIIIDFWQLSGFYGVLNKATEMISSTKCAINGFNNYKNNANNQNQPILNENLNGNYLIINRYNILKL